LTEVVGSSAEEVHLGEEKEEEKLKAQQMQQQDELKFKTIFENANDCMFVVDVSGRILDVNKKAVTLFGRTKEELQRKHFSRLGAVSPKDIPRLVNGLAEVFAGKKSSLMLNVRSKAGQDIALECSGSLMKVGDKPSVLVIARDVSERKRMEEALKESEERHRSLFELAPDGVLLADLKGNVTAANEAFLRVTGFSKEEIVGKYFTKLPTIQEFDMPKYMKLFLSFLRGKKAGPVEFVYSRKDGTLAWADAHPALLKEKGKVTGFQVVLRDITERKKAEEKVKESQQKFEKLFKGNPEAAVFSDANDYVLDINSRFTELFGYSPDEAIGKFLDDLIVPDGLKEEAKRLTEIREGYVYRDTVRKRKDGSIVPVSISCASITSGNQCLGNVILYADITERKQAEQALKMSEDRYRSIFEKANDGIIFVDLTGKIVEINDKAAEIAGMKREEILSKRFTKLGLIGLKDVPRLLGRLAFRARGEDQPYSLELTVERKSGEKRLLEINTSIIRKGLLHSGLLAVVRDVTERKAAENARRESEERYRNLVENSKDSIVIIDLNGNVLFANKATETLTGYAYQNGIRMNVRDITPMKLWPKSLAMLLKARQGKAIPYFESMIRRKDGSLIQVESGGQAIFKDGKVVGILIITRDISERRKAEDELRKSESKYRTLLENVPQKIFLKDRNSAYVSCNENYARDLKIESNEIVGKTDYDFYPKELAEKYRVDDKRVMESGETHDIEEEYIENGQKKYVHTVKTPGKDENGNVVGILGIFWDITESKKMELAVKQSEEKYRKQFEEAMDAIFVADAQTGVITDCNRAALELLGYEKSELIGKHQRVLHPQQEIDGDFSKTFRQHQSEKEGQVLETRVVTKKGDIRDVAVKANLIELGDKRILQGIFRDITENKRKEEALRESEEKYRNLFESARDVIITGDLQGKITNVNKVIEEYGFKRDDIIGKSQLEFVDKKYWPNIIQGVAHIAHGRMNTGEVEINTPKGKVAVEYRSNPLLRDNKAVGFQTILHNITERKALEEKLRQYSEHLEELVQKRSEELFESEKRYSVLVEEASDGVAILQDGKIVFTNKKGLEITGYSKDELIGLPFEKIVSEEYSQLAKERYERRLRGETIPLTYEVELIAKTGNRISVELSAARIDYRGHPADLLVVRDISQRKRMEETRSRLEKLAAIGELATMVGHDLRNPLQSIENAAYYLNRELPKYNITQQATEMLQIINSSIDYADKIIRDLQDYATTRKPTLQAVNLNNILKETISQTKVPENVQVTPEFEQLPDMKIDQDMMLRVFLNLATNGIQAMEKGGTLTISTKQTGGFVEISFKDTGIGISKENLPLLFTPLFTTKAKGMGMGLAICKKFVDSHQGTIHVESEEGKGTTFTVKLPVIENNKKMEVTTIGKSQTTHTSS
jgi:PAS domain S-box-containing protein